MTEPKTEVFFRALSRSQLIEPSRLKTSLDSHPSLSARDFANYLIQSGDLTHYQAEKLLQGLWQGLVLGHYHVLAPLGRGGMGTVYLARDTRTQGDHPALVALKVLPPKRARQEERTLARFRREMDLGRHLSHPNVTRTLDAGQIAGIHYIAMEYVPGQSLRQLVVASGPLAVPLAAKLFADVADGLVHAHGRGLIHRDLKPSNIMVTPDGRAKILDLGLALLMGESLPSDPSIVGGQGYVLGTMDYIAPEQTTDATNVGPATDLYALGCSLYFSLTGTPPFPGGTAQQKIRWHRSQEPPLVTSLNPTIPVDFAQLVAQLMQKRPQDRPASAGTLKDLLAPWANESAAMPVFVGISPKSAEEAFEGIDNRAFDPTLWDAAPVAGAVEATENRDSFVGLDRAKHRAKTEHSPNWVPLLLVGAAAGALILLVLLFGVLRRL